jgi:hypothetical protein
MGNTNFGPMDLYSFDICEEMTDGEGLLGMDFLKKHRIYLDFDKKLAYIEKN